MSLVYESHISAAMLRSHLGERSEHHPAAVDPPGCGLPAKASRQCGGIPSDWLNGRFNGLDQCRPIDWLAKNASMMRAPNPGQIELTAGGNEDDGQLWPFQSDAPQQLDAIHTGHPDIADQEIDILHCTTPQKCFA